MRTNFHWDLVSNRPNNSTTTTGARESTVNPAKEFGPAGTDRALVENDSSCRHTLFTLENCTTSPRGRLATLKNDVHRVRGPRSNLVAIGSRELLYAEGGARRDLRVGPQKDVTVARRERAPHAHRVDARL